MASLLEPSVQRVGDDDTRTRARTMLQSEPGLRPDQRAGYVRNLATMLAIFNAMAARRAMRWAPAVLADQELAIETGTYLAIAEARPSRLTWALTTAAGDLRLLRGLLDILAQRVALDSVRWAWGLAAGDLATTKDIVDYDAKHRATGVAVHALAVTAIEDAGGDVGVAEAEMTSLAAYDYDPALRTRSAGRAEALADEQVEHLSGTARATHDTAVEALGPDTPHTGRKLAQWKKKANTAKAKQNAASRQQLELTRDADISAALASRPGLTDAARTAMENFLAHGRSTGLVPADGAWLLDRTDGRADLATALRPLFDGARDGRAATEWVLALGTAAPAVHRRVTALGEAVAAGLDVATAQSVVGLAQWPALASTATGALATAIVANGAVRAGVVGWLAAAASLPTAVDVLLTWHRKSGTLAEFLTVAGRTTPNELAALVTMVGVTASDAAVHAVQTVLIQGVSPEDLKKVVAHMSPQQAETLLTRVAPLGGAVDARLFTVLARATGAQVLSWIVTRGYDVSRLHTWLVTKGWAAATLDPLIQWASAGELVLLLDGDTPATLAPLMAQGASHLYDLRLLAWKEDEVRKFSPTLAILAGAHAVAPQWNRGTFAEPLHSVVYHYCKHVRDTNLPQTIAQYSADALNLWATRQQQSFPWNSGRKISLNTGRGGTYTNAGVPYSFWY